MIIKGNESMEKPKNGDLDGTIPDDCPRDLEPEGKGCIKDCWDCWHGQE